MVPRSFLTRDLPFINAPEALVFFGTAVHTVTDVQSPEHAGYQEWRGLGWGPSNWINDARGLAHYSEEAFAGTRLSGSGEIAKAQAVYEAQVLWAQYQAMLKARRKEEEERKKREQCKEDRNAPGCRR